jgi:hypothetical protein
MVPFVHYVLLYGLRTLFGIEPIKALPSLLFSDEPLMELVGFNAQQVRHGVCQRERAPGPICPDALAKTIVKWWWLDQQGIRFGVPAKTNMAVTADTRAQAAAWEDLTVGRRVHTVRQGQGKGAWSEWLETEEVGITGLTTDDQYGTPEHAHHAHLRDFQANPINAVVVRRWQGKDYGPGGKTVLLTNASVQPPLQSSDDDGDRSLMENYCLTGVKRQWDLGHSPQKTEQAV